MTFQTGPDAHAGADPTAQFWDLITNLAGDLMPGPEREIPRDLFLMLASVWAIQAEKGVPHDPYALLRHVRDRAWQGYADTGRLAEAIRQELPRSQGAARMARYFEEIAAKRSACLFLPIVSRVDRHQAKQRPPERLELDVLGEEWADTQFGYLTRQAFAEASPGTSRERDAFLFALMSGGWGQGPRLINGPEVIGLAAAQLRRLYEQPEAALANVYVDVNVHPAAARMIEAAEEVEAADRPLWLEALFLAEAWLAGTQRFEHAFEMKGGPLREILAQAGQ
ncbi:MAG: hypothetical protein JOZ05_08775 [Acetobacteraceae bacterium]|nr:hypothetical protein [Acetobacteraceae bacterium]